MAHMPMASCTCRTFDTEASDLRPAALCFLGGPKRPHKHKDPNMVYSMVCCSMVYSMVCCSIVY